MKIASSRVGVMAALVGLLATVSGAAEPEIDVAALEKQVHAAERAFAKTMADRDHAAFASFVAEDAVFFGQRALRGRDEVAAAWKPFFDGPEAPFSWEPVHVAVLASGKLALSSGPVYDPAGKRVGTFNSTWRLDPDGAWRVVFDKGCPPCECP